MNFTKIRDNGKQLRKPNSRAGLKNKYFEDLLLAKY